MGNWPTTPKKENLNGHWFLQESMLWVTQWSKKQTIILISKTQIKNIPTHVLKTLHPVVYYIYNNNISTHEAQI